MLNTVILEGNLTRDVDLVDGYDIAHGTIALNYNYEQDGVKKQETTFVDLSFFADVAKWAASNLSKGDMVFVYGRLHTKYWIDKNSNVKKSKMIVIGDRVIKRWSNKNEEEKNDLENF